VKLHLRAALLDSDVARIAREVADHLTLEDVLAWGRCQPPGTVVPGVIAGVVVQDEYGHDVIVPWRDGLVLVYDST